MNEYICRCCSDFSTQDNNSIEIYKVEREAWQPSIEINLNYVCFMGIFMPNLISSAFFIVEIGVFMQTNRRTDRESE